MSIYSAEKPPLLAVALHYLDQVLALFDASPEGQALGFQGFETFWTALILD